MAPVWATSPPPLIMLRRVGLASLGLFGALLALMLLGLIAADAGALNGLAKSLFFAKTHRALSFGRVRLHLLETAPALEVDDLVVGSPNAITPKDLAHIGHAAIQLQFAPLLIGHAVPVSIALQDVTLQMIRLGHGQNNYSFGGKGLSAFLRPVKRLSITNAKVTYDDPERGLTLVGLARYDSTALPRPLHLDGGGISHGEPYTILANGGPLIGRGPGAPYLFDAKLRDGATTLEAAGSSQAPFDFRGFDLAIHAAGPNLADVGYLFNIDIANSPTFEATAHASRIGHVVRFEDLRAKIGASDVSGSFVSDHSHPRRVLSADFRSRLIRAKDVSILLAPRPNHATARDTPGVAAPRAKGSFSDKPFPVDALRKLDLNIKLNAAEVTGYVSSFSTVNARLVLHQGRLQLRPFTARAGGGVVQATLAIDATGATPKVYAQAALAAGRLSQLRLSASALADGVLDASVQLEGSGVSPKALLSRASGGVGARLRDGVIQRSKASALSGDPLQAAWLGLVNNADKTALRCARADFSLQQGFATARTIDIITALGATTGAGRVDLARDQMQITLTPDPGSPGRTNVSPSISISGPIEHPKVAVDVKSALAKGGLAAVATMVTTPFRSHKTASLPLMPAPCPPLS